MNFLKYLKYGISDFYFGLKSWPLWLLLGWMEVKQRYHRSSLGPFWLTISMGVHIITMGVVFGSIFVRDTAEYLPTLAIGIVFWNYLSQSLQESCYTFIDGGTYLKQIKISYSILIYRVAWRNFIIFIHNAIIMVLVVVYFNISNLHVLIYLIPGMVLFMLNIIWVSSLLGLMSARFRDVPQIVSSVMQILFYVSPLLFTADLIPKKHYWIITYNPITYLLDVVRSPVLGTLPNSVSWYITIIMALIGLLISFIVCGKFFKKIVYWV
jgi:lipopolysaccharide transport system permease protein